MSTLRILAWNIFQLPSSLTRHAQQARIGPTCSKLAHYADIYGLDAIVLSEVFDEDAHKAIVGRLGGRGRRFPYVSPRPMGPFGAINDGGVMILAREGAELAFEEVYDDGIGADQFAAKGAVAVRIRKEDRTALIVGTHLQAGPDSCPRQDEDIEADARAVRRKQVTQLKSWIDDVRRQRERVVLAGDLNVDGSAEASSPDAREYSNMCGTLGLEHPPAWAEGTTLRHTYAPNINTLAQRTCGGNWKPRLLDHVLISGLVQGSRRWVTRPETSTAWRREWVSLSYCNKDGESDQRASQLIDTDLSDHLPVVAEIP